MIPLNLVFVRGISIIIVPVWLLQTDKSKNLDFETVIQIPDYYNVAVTQTQWHLKSQR